MTPVLRYSYNPKTNRWFLNVGNETRGGICTCENCVNASILGRGINYQTVLDYMQDTKGMWD